MKKLFISLMLVTMFVTLSAQQRNIVKTNPFTLAFGNFNATYERVLNSSSSLLFQANYMFKSFGMDVSTGGLGVGYRYYFTHAKKQVPSGFYVNPEASFSIGSVNMDYYGEPGSTQSGISIFGIGAELGYQWAWSSGFTLDLGIGPMYRFVTGETNGFSRTNGISPAATVAVGFAF